MKKALSLLLTLVMCLSLCACGSNDTPETTETTETTATTETPTEPVVKLELGETVSTDLAEFTLLDSTFTYYADGLSTNYVAPTDNGVYAASIGHCLVSVTFQVKNKNRTSCSFACGAGWMPKWTVSYKGADYSVKGYSLSDSDKSWIDLAYSAILSNDGKTTVKTNDVSGYILSAGETITMRTIGVINVDPDNLTDGFDFTVNVPNSAGEYEYFTYTIST